MAHTVHLLIQNKADTMHYEEEQSHVWWACNIRPEQTCAITLTCRALEKQEGGHMDTWQLESSH